MDINTLGYQAYKKTQVQTADQGKLILMCYDGTINFLKQARIAHEGKEIRIRDELLSKSMNLLWELDNGLNFEAGEIAYNLDSLYNYMIRRITEAQFHDKMEVLTEVISYLQELKESWETVILKQF
jgi:flagellar protein FliS